MSTKVQETIDSIKKIGKAYVFGANLIPESMLEVIGYALACEPENDIQAVFVTNSGPHEAYGEYCKHSRSFIINLKHIIWKAFNDAKDKPVNISIPVQITCDIIHTIYHELYHNVAKAVVGEDDYELAEDEADEYAEENMEKAIHNLKIDCINITTLPEGFDLINMLSIEPESVGEEQLNTHYQMIKEGIVFENADGKYTSLREYIKDTTKFPEIYQSNENPGAEMKMEVNSDMTREKNADGSTALISDPNGLHAAAMRSAGASEEDIARGVRNYEQFCKENPEGCNLPTTDGSEQEYGPMDTVIQPGIIYEEDDSPPWDDDDSPPWDDEPAVMETPASQTTVDLPVVAAPVGGDLGNTLGAVAAQRDRLVYEEDEGNTEEQPPPPRDVQSDLATIKGLYKRLNDHIFDKCGFNNGTYSNIEAIYQPIKLTDAEAALVAASQTRLSNGTTGDAYPSECDNQIAGILFKEGTVPAYDLKIRWAGSELKVRLVSQNPKLNSATAARARAGERILWVIDHDNDKFRNKFINGEYLPA